MRIRVDPLLAFKSRADIVQSNTHNYYLINREILEGNRIHSISWAINNKESDSYSLHAEQPTYYAMPNNIKVQGVYKLR